MVLHLWSFSERGYTKLTAGAFSFTFAKCLPQRGKPANPGRVVTPSEQLLQF